MNPFLGKDHNDKRRCHSCGEFISLCRWTRHQKRCMGLTRKLFFKRIRLLRRMLKKRGKDNEQVKRSRSRPLRIFTKEDRGREIAAGPTWTDNEPSSTKYTNPETK